MYTNVYVCNESIVISNFIREQLFACITESITIQQWATGSVPVSLVWAWASSLYNNTQYCTSVIVSMYYVIMWCHVSCSLSVVGGVTWGQESMVSKHRTKKAWRTSELKFNQLLIDLAYLIILAHEIYFYWITMVVEKYLVICCIMYVWFLKFLLLKIIEV